MCVCVCGLRLLTQQVLHALSRLDDLGADRRAADAVQDVISFVDDLNVVRQKPVLCFDTVVTAYYHITVSQHFCHKLGIVCFHQFL